MEWMADGVAVIMMIKRAVQLVGVDGVERAQKHRKGGGALLRVFRRDAINLASIAGREDESFFQDAARAKLFGRTARLFHGERYALAHLDGCCAMVQSDENNFHPVLRAPKRSGATAIGIDSQHSHSAKRSRN